MIKQPRGRRASHGASAQGQNCDKKMRFSDWGLCLALGRLLHCANQAWRWFLGPKSSQLCHSYASISFPEGFTDFVKQIWVCPAKQREELKSMLESLPKIKWAKLGKLSQQGGRDPGLAGWMSQSGYMIENLKAIFNWCIHPLKHEIKDVKVWVMLK